MGNETNGVLDKLITGLAVAVGTAVVSETISLIKSNSGSSIEVGEWDNAYYNVNKIVYFLDKKAYTKHRLPTCCKSHYELNIDASYIIKLKDKNYIKVKCYRNEKTQSYQEHRLKLTFFGKDKYTYRKKLISNALNLTDKKHIRVVYLGKDKTTFQDILPHDFDKIVLDDEVKTRIVSGLTNWRDSKDWYTEHQLTHKIGVFLYGKAGTGKSTIAKSISSMFGNAPIMTVDANNIMNSIDGITKFRQSINGTMIVLIEDFDMFFKSREEVENLELDIEKKKQKDNNQNALFQMLDGVYSTDNTIYIATTNYKNRIDSALIRYGRFDIQEELDYFSKEDSIKAVELLGYDSKVLDDSVFSGLEYPIQPAYLQSKIMEYRTKSV